jgi:hypothetical protein
MDSLAVHGMLPRLSKIFSMFGQSDGPKQLAFITGKS